MFGERLKMIRKQAGLSQKLLASQLYVSQQSVWKWEMNESSPNPETIAKIAEIFDVSTDYLLGRTDQKEKPPMENEELSRAEMELVNAYRDAPANVQAAIRTLLERK